MTGCRVRHHRRQLQRILQVEVMSTRIQIDGNQKHPTNEERKKEVHLLTPYHDLSIDELESVPDLSEMRPD